MPPQRRIFPISRIVFQIIKTAALTEERKVRAILPSSAKIDGGKLHTRPSLILDDTTNKIVIKHGGCFPTKKLYSAYVHFNPHKKAE
jgi:hypothetical protein